MGLWELPPVDVRSLLREERVALLALLNDLDLSAWDRPTVCPGWSVKDVVLHILDDDLGWLSRGRDGDRSGLLTGFADHNSFITALNNKNQRWVEATCALSPRVIRTLLGVAGTEMDAYWASMDLMAEGRVAWASPDPVPLWFDIAQDLTERWVHQQQIRDAVDRPGVRDERFLGPVLRTFLWALPLHYAPRTGPDANLAIHLSGAGGGSWRLHRRQGQWDLVELDPASTIHAPDATVRLDTNSAWRLLTGAPFDHDRLVLSGDPDLANHFAAARGILM
ncbi:maleylpyruvate isomerase N-terminal domain-containing protein [Streptomyces sp. NWU339]|uniref:maleylpyruvate isomerase N-terminal domain-containing protein n=1 Tax=Streptomyces sp. NWU339 TaxID=2185284 RepID=UPI0015E81AC2|nr:maleylpyruvate isomerase family mycothiol-dependent enzyme [Streptomyces sp. NWU339]